MANKKKKQPKPKRETESWKRRNEARVVLQQVYAANNKPQEAASE